MALAALVCVGSLGISSGEPSPARPTQVVQDAGPVARVTYSGWIDPKGGYLDTARRLTASALSSTGEARVGYALGAADAARRSLAFGPANAYAWVTLAWAEYAAGNKAGAWDALEMSWRWAPESGNLSFMRLLLSLNWWPEADAGERVRIVEEARMARVTHRAAFIDEMQRNPRLWTVWRLIYEIDYPKEQEK